MMQSIKYWAVRSNKAQAAATAKGIKATEEQLIKYYGATQKKLIGQFEQIYNKVMSSIDEGRKPTPADLYKLDSYWKMQGQLKEELTKLGDKQAALFSKQFVEQYQNIYDTLALPSGGSYSTISTEAAEQMIKQIWCADGKSWSDRIWANTDKLQQTLNDNLIDCLITGKKPTELKHILQEQFGAAYNRADTVVRTEMAHIQTQAAQQRYKESGITEIEVLADDAECEICKKLDGKRFSIKATVPIPAHPNCRCSIIPRIDALTLSNPYDNINKSKLIGMPASQTSGSNEDIRKWYYVNIHDIPNRIDYSLSIEQQAKQASDIRNQIKLEARKAMQNKELAKELNIKEKPKTLEQLIDSKMYRYKFTREEALNDIIRSAAITNESVDNELFGG